MSLYVNCVMEGFNLLLGHIPANIYYTLCHASSIGLDSQPFGNKGDAIRKYSQEGQKQQPVNYPSYSLMPYGSFREILIAMK